MVDAQIAKKLSRAVREEMDLLIFDGPSASHQTESPAEAWFLAAWHALELVRRAEVGRPYRYVWDSQVETLAGERRYRLDFAIVDEAHGIKFAVEVDGHDFHERTPEQVAKRNTRDADLVDAGWKVVHVSGSQLWRDPWGCAIRVEESLETAYDKSFRNGR